jgi:hypothetical protein
LGDQLVGRLNLGLAGAGAVQLHTALGLPTFAIGKKACAKSTQGVYTLRLGAFGAES